MDRAVLPVSIILLYVVKSLVDNALLNITNIENLAGAVGLQSDVVDVSLKVSKHTSIINRRTVSPPLITGQKLVNESITLQLRHFHCECNM